MTLLVAHSFDGFSTTEAPSKNMNLASGAAIDAAAGRNGSAGMRSGNTNFGGRIIFPSTVSDFIFGFGYRISAAVNAAVALFNETPTDSNSCHLALTVSPLGKLVLRRAHNGTILATGTKTLLPGVFYYIDGDLIIHDSTGSAEIRVNGVVDIAVTGADTRNGGTGVVGGVWLGYDGSAVSLNMDFDDFYICDKLGGVNDDYLGDVRIENRLPSGNGTTSNLVGSDADSTDNYLLVDEAVPNSDTDYVESSTVSDKDTYAMQNATPTTVASIPAVVVNVWARKTDAGARSIASVVRLSGGTEADSADHTLGTTYACLTDIRETKPGGGAWALADWNGAEVGLKVTA